MLFNLERSCRWCVASLLSRVSGKVRTLHRDERGTISILSVIALLMLTMLLGMIINVGEQVDDKLKMQNAADAATYSSGVVLARGMNTIAFTNHLLSETFALTAYFREGRDRYAESLVPEILDAWQTVDQQLGLSNFRLIRDIQPAIAPKIQIEREIVQAFGDMTAVKARLLLPPLQTILGIPEVPGAVPSAQDQQQIAMSHLIPVFQRAVVLAIPTAASEISREIAKRNTPGRVAQSTQCVLWTTRTMPVLGFNQRDPYQRFLPGLDPSNEGPDVAYLNYGEVGVYQGDAKQRRNGLAHHYLAEWNRDRGYDLGPFERENRSEGGRVSAKMSNFIHLWRGFTKAKLDELLNNEYPTTNLPHMLRRQSPGVTQQQYLEGEFTFDGAVYRRQRRATMPGMYRVPIRGDAFAFSRVSVYLPTPRFLTSGGCSRFLCPSIDFWGTVSCGVCYDNWPTEWSLFDQHWAAKMIPTSAESTIALIQTNPQQAAPGVTLPNVNSIQLQDLKAINFH